MITFAVRRPISVLMIGLALIVLGIISIQKIPLNLMPSIKVLDFQIIITSKGTSAEEIERTIIDPIEKSIGTTPGIIRTNSIAQKDIGRIFIRFRSDIDLVETLSILKDRLEMVGLPEGASKPRIQRDQRNMEPIIRAVLSRVDQSKNETDWLEEVKNTLIRDIERVSGVASVNILGGPEKYIQVRISPDRLRAYAIQPQAVADAIQDSNRFLNIGEIKIDKNLMPIRIGAELKSLAEVQQVVIRRDGNKVVRVADIAEVSFIEEKSVSEVRSNGKSGIILEVRREPEANAVKTAQAVMNLLKTSSGSGSQGESSAEDTLNKLYSISLISNQGEEIQVAINNVFNSVRDGALLAGLIVFLLIQSGWPTFVINIAIPLSLLMTFVLMHFTGVSFNLMSLAGLALGVGMLVDNSTVVLQSISLESQHIQDLLEASIQGAKKVASAITASTISTVAVFGPLAFVPGVVGQMFRDVAATVCYSIFSSLLVSLIFIPMFSAHQDKFLRKNRKPRENFNSTDLIVKDWNLFRAWVLKQRMTLKFLLLSLPKVGIIFQPIKAILSAFTQKVFALTNAVFGRLESGLRNSIDNAFKFKTYYLMGSLATVLIGILILQQRGSQLFPEDPTDQLIYEIGFTPGTAPEKKVQATKNLEDRIQKFKEVQDVIAIYGLAPGTETKLFIKLKEIATPEVTNLVSRELSALPEIIPNRKKATMVSEEKAIRVEFISDDLSQIEKSVFWAKERLRSIEGLVELRSSSQPTANEISIEFNKAKLSLLSADPAQFLSPLKVFLKGADAGGLNLDGKTFPMRVLKETSSFRNMNSLEFYSIDNDEQKPIYLRQVAEFKENRNASIIYRSEKKRLGFVEADFSGKDLGLANESIYKILKSEFPYKDVEFRLAGQELERKENNRNLMIAIGLSILVIFLLLASQFESLSQPLVVLASVPFCILGMSIFIWLFGLQISVLVFVGFIILVGSSVNSSIVMVDYANDLILHGSDEKEAIIKSTQRRMRPILVTTLSNVFGLVPMAIATAEKGSGMQQPIAVTILGGLVSSTTLTLVVVPVLFVLATASKRSGGKSKAAKGQSPKAERLSPQTREQ